jgi:hypothetical protein
MKSAFKILVRKNEGKRPLGRNIHRWEDNIKLVYVDWIRLAQDREEWRSLVNTKRTGNFLTS